MKVSVKAYAKINLFLDMVSKKEDGYHNILSLMQSVTLHDTVSVEYAASEERDISVFCDSLDIPCDNGNLAYRAAEKYPFANGKIRISIEKRIPVSAGLAGGSADAAAVLVALNKLCGEPMTPDQLKNLGATLGADVPFCIECGSSLTEGIGEKMSHFAPMPNYPIIIAKKGEGMSTPLAYRKLDNLYNDFLHYTPNSHKLSILGDTSSALDSYCAGIYNIFEEVVEPERPCVSEIKGIMLDHGAANATMSGSGTAVFGVFKDELSANNALLDLRKYGANAYLCYPCNSRERISELP